MIGTVKEHRSALTQGWGEEKAEQLKTNRS